ncbi:MAG: dihydroorotase [Thermodesulfobacteriota bacterium]
MDKPDTIIKNALWQDEYCDLYIANGKVLALLHSGETDAASHPGANIHEANGSLLLPGLLDSHVHLRDPGQEYKEDINSGLQAAASGGFSHVMAMANTVPVNDQAGITQYMLNKANSSHPCGPFLHPIGSLTKNLQGMELAPLQELAQTGCIAFSNDGVPIQDTSILRSGLEYSSSTGLRVVDHCEDPYLGTDTVINEGKQSSRLGLKGQPTLAESIHVSRDILLSEYLDIPIHIAHVSCRESVELLAQAKRKGLRVTAETCPHYLVWDESRVEEFDSLAKVNPPLRSRDDVQAVRQALREGSIDILVTDHAPHAEYEKDAPIAQAPAGISGLDTALGLTWYLVQEKILSLEDVLRCWCHNPAEIFNIKNNRFWKDDPADFILFNPGETWKVKPENMRSKGKNTPCLGKELPGRIKYHFINGNLIFQA